MLEIRLRTIITALLFTFFFNPFTVKDLGISELVAIENNSNNSTITELKSSNSKEEGAIRSEFASHECTPTTYRKPHYWTIPVHYEKKNMFEKSQEILTYIFTKLPDDAPAILMYGTLLYEFRNSTAGDPCLHTSLIDKDVDIAVYPMHMQFIAAMKDEIKTLFNWDVIQSERKAQLGFLSINPPQGVTYGIDFYAFQYDVTNNLIQFTWDGVKVERNAFLPFRKQKQMLSDDSSNQTKTNVAPNYYVPNNAHNILCNIYGTDYMTPKTGPSSQAKYNGQNGRPAHGNAECGNITITTEDEIDLPRWLDPSLFTTIS